MSGNQGDDMYNVYNRVETAETLRKRGEGLHESSSTAFCVNLLESLFLLSLEPAVSPHVFATADLGTNLVDNAESSHEETQKNGHESINGAMTTR